MNKNLPQQYNQGRNQLAPIDSVTGLPANYYSGKNPQEQHLINAICARYDLDPATKEVDILHGQIYINARGVKRIATRDPSFDGCEIEIIHADWDKYFFIVKASVWLKGVERPVEDYADSEGSQMKGGAKFRHAITRAQRRAMSTAFAIPFPSEEEIKSEPLPQQAPQVQESAIDPFAMEAEISAMRSASSLDELKSIWSGITLKTELLPIKDQCKAALETIHQREATEPPHGRSELNRRCHALVSEKIDAGDPHVTLRALSGKVSLKDVSDDEFEILMQELEAYDPTTEATKSAIDEVELLLKVGKDELEKEWGELRPVWTKMPIKDRILIWSAYENAKANVKE